MKKVFSFGRKVVKNKIIYYILSRYATYLIQFINSIFIAIYLGPFYLGVWGFITLVIQYLNQINFGVAHSVNAIISIHKQREWYVQRIIGTSFYLLILLSFFVALFFILNSILNINIGGKYSFLQYAPLVAFIGIFGHFNTLFSNIFRVYGKITEIAINQSIFPILMLIVLLIFKGSNLLLALVIVNLISVVFSFSIFILRFPIKLKLFFIWRLMKKIQIKGWYLFVYNTSFYLIMISTRSLVSAYYSVEEFGFFTFSFTLASAVILLLESISFLIFPKLLNRFASLSNSQTTNLLESVRDGYITLSHLLIHIVILLFPFLLLLIPKYESASDTFKLISLALVLFTNTFGYQGLLIARGEEKLLGKLSLFALFVNISLCLILILIVKVDFSFVILSTLFTYLIYVYLIGYNGSKKLCLNDGFSSVTKDVFPIRLFLPYLTSFSLIYLSVPNLYFVFPLLLYIILNYKVLIKSKEILFRIINNDRVIDI